MIEVIVPPVIDQALIDLATDHLKVDESATDVLIAEYVEAAVLRVEAMSGRKLFTRTLRLHADAFGTALELPESPVQSVSTVTYVDTAGATQTLAGAAYSLIDRLETPMLYPVYATTWPATRVFPGVVKVDFLAGYGDDMEDIPAPLRMAVFQTVADWFRFGGSVATTSIMELPESAYRACLSFRRHWA